ncbi:TetR/AcrR family transcriptional regulator [Syntrophomonas palmitatica]|uniref:TetR/AcrR family transcriptional regulator n=1 Tax=Syntrophomonas palmitatica TaxID=402877 RepID=UPI0006CFC05C|nr:TetR/AcrR family transcriptional regulator [Syntrophomonas palmitatica]
MKLNTKERIREAALSIFANKGYEGATMQEIAEAVGINKASIYNHYKGKEDLFFAVYQDVADDYVKLMERVIGDSKDMKLAERLFYIFEEEILYFYRNPESQAFWNQITLFTPDVLREEFWKDLAQRELFFRTQMEALFFQGMEEGIIRRDDPAKLMFTFRAMKEGLLNWMIATPKSEEEWIRAVWKDFWLGFRARSDFEENDEWLNRKTKPRSSKSSPYQEGLDEYKAECLICKKDFQIPFTDFRYKDIKYNRGAFHVCDDCGKTIQDEAQLITGLTPELIDIWERLFPGQKTAQSKKLTKKK